VTEQYVKGEICPYAMVYMVWWPEHHVVKFGFAWKMSRIYEFMRTGAELIYVSKPMRKDGEKAVLSLARQRFQRAFATAKDAEFLFWRGRGFSECFIVPDDRLEEAIDDCYVGGIAAYAHHEEEALAWRRSREPGADLYAGYGPAACVVAEAADRLDGAGDPRPETDSRCDLADETEAPTAADAGGSRGHDDAARRDGLAADLLAPDRPVDDAVSDHRDLAAGPVARPDVEPAVTPEISAPGCRSNRCRDNSSRGRGRERAGERVGAGSRLVPPSTATRTRIVPRRDLCTCSTPAIVGDQAFPITVLQPAQRWTSRGRRLSRLRHSEGSCRATPRAQDCPAPSSGAAADRARVHDSRDRRRVARARGSRGGSWSTSQRTADLAWHGVHRDLTRAGP